MARILFAIFVLIGSTSATHAQDFHAWNFDIGGGVGFPVSQSSNFANSGGNFVVGGGRNFMTGLGVNSEFMWHDLPPKRSLLDAFQAPDGSARVYAWTLNGIVRIPTGRRFGAYVIGGGGWYHRSGELTNPVLVPGTICTPPIYWWSVGCVDGLVPSHEVIASRSSDAFGGNIGGGLTIPLSENGFSFYVEARYHHDTRGNVSTEVVPLTFGFRW
ncbi:MAG: outer membrane beta-barrel protein [Candidatus Acidiferrum sp.]